ncbi:MAG: family 1 glycosylhydrolase [Anaerolineales bacterium]|nr:family 1 glycosylhydrolase [Anaerolineales bacterium]
MAQARMIFPADFLWGTATAAYQVEGNNENSDWWQWERQNGRILEGHRADLACDWWQNAEADLDRAADLGTNAHRLSVEWSRIEPEPSRFDTAAIARYREILQAMVDRGIEPMVTLHHFSNPLWLVEKGDFNSDIVVDYFRRYVARVVEAFGDLVPKWVTINEPMVYVFMRYLQGHFPAPSRPGWLGALEAARNLLRCHAAAYHAIKEKQPAAQVGVAKNMAVLQAWPGASAAARGWARRVSWLYNDMWLESVMNGRLRFPAGRGSIPHLAGTLDFLGINYYTRFYVKFPPFGGLVMQQWTPDAVVSDGSYGEIYPEGLYASIVRALKYDRPLYITENGIPDRADRHRPGYLLTHLREIWRALSFCFPVMGYYHWTLVDNFEWDRGWTQRFGLFELDPETQARRPRASAALYRAICRQNAISSEMTAAYAPALLETLFPGQAPL